MKRHVGLLFVVAIALPALFSPRLAWAQSQQNQSAQGLPSGEVAAMCPPGSHWVESGYHGTGGKYKNGHCQKEFSHLEKTNR